MYICRALFLAWAVAQGRKHGYSSFSLEIVEYCELGNLLERENYYFNLLKPEYNLCLSFKTDTRLE
jgi:hypothetical protein